MIIVDASVWIDYLNGVQNPQTAWLDSQAETTRLGLSDITLCEVLQGIDGDVQAAEIQRELLKLAVIPIGSVEIALQASQNSRKLRERGQKVSKTINCLIATFCIRFGHTLLHNDQDYDKYEQNLGLSVVHC
jgi:predicted nucleic acid-binding protein